MRDELTCQTSKNSIRENTLITFTDKHCKYHVFSICEIREYDQSLTVERQPLNLIVFFLHVTLRGLFISSDINVICFIYFYDWLTVKP